MQAIILAAGLGTRLREYTDKPKGLITLGEQSILAESIAKLVAYGISDILLVTGYCAQEMENKIAKPHHLTTVLNPDYSCSGSLYSLSLAKDWIKEDFLILEADIIYEDKALHSLLSTPHQDATLVADLRDSWDAVYVTHNDYYLTGMSKNKSDLIEKSILGEFVGISKVSLTSWKALQSTLLFRLNDNQFLAYEECGLVALAQQSGLFCVYTPGLYWKEIDSPDDVIAAKKIYPLTIHKTSE